MTPFLQYLAQYIFEHHENDTRNLCIVLPNKRGALYLKQHLAKAFNKTIWLPTIISAEELVAQLSGLEQADSIDLICELYETYSLVLGEKAEPFESFAKWGNLMLQDFNEADRYLVDTKSLYQNLKEIKEIENWSLNADKLTETQEDYCNFMFQMGTIYQEFSKRLLQKKYAYQGLMYRKAVDAYKDSSYVQQFSHILIAGFNALNKAETIIFSDLVKERKASIIWDADEYYVNNDSYEAGLFLRKNFSNQWLNSKQHIGNYFKDIPKHIDIVAVPKQIGQAQIVSHQLHQWIKEGKSLNKTAVVLADESLLFPILNQLPSEVEHVNITMEYPLRLSPIYDLIDNLISLHLSRQKAGASSSYYFADVFKILQNTLFKQYYQSFHPNQAIQTIIQKIIDKNYVWMNEKVLSELFEEDYRFISHLFVNWKDSKMGIESVSSIIGTFNTGEEEVLRVSPSEKEYLHVFTKYFNRLQLLIQTHQYLNSIQTLRSLYKQIIGAASVPFIGEPLRGLQIMGVLETRTLDFENIILLGVNEGVLPSGKSMNSFIPNDLKRFHGMPLYGDKDAIYAYHFYRLMQRATNIVLTYNTEHSVLGSGEKSRFITQLQFELKKYNSANVITERMLSGGNLPASKRNEITIEKNPKNLEPIILKLTKDDQYSGLSPSALNSYKDCSLRFFFRYGAGIKETEDVEESAEANTQGTILHESLERLYLPFVGKVLSADNVKDCMQQMEEVVNQQFQNYFTQSESRFGKNFLQRKVLYEYVNKLLKSDLKLINQAPKTNELLSLIALEKELSSFVEISINNVTTKVYIKGSVDRIDKLGNTFRVIDYKSSIHQSDKFKFAGFEELFANSSYNKMLQLFIYAWLVVKNNLAHPEEISPCIIPFKKFEEQPRAITAGDKKAIPLVFSDELLQDFEDHLKQNIREIISLDKAFIQTEDLDQCEYCAYASICNVN